MILERLAGLIRPLYLGFKEVLPAATKEILEINPAFQKLESNAAQKPREIIVVAQEEYNRIAKENFEQKLKEILEKSIDQRSPNRLGQINSTNLSRSG